MSAVVFLEIFLPQLSFESPPEMALDEVLDFLALNLSPSHMLQIKRLSDYYDVENLRSYLLGQPMTARGNVPRHRLEEYTLLGDCSIPGTESFFEAYPDLDTQRKHAHELMPSFLKKRSKESSSFVQKNYLFEYRLRHIFAYLRAVSLGKTYTLNEGELSFFLDDVDSWPEEFLKLPTLWKGVHRGPLEFEHSIAKWKFEYYDSLGVHNTPFSFKTILIYFLKLRLLESRRSMKNPQHSHTLERMAKVVQ
jgi:hypothetical protein